MPKSKLGRIVRGATITITPLNKLEPIVCFYLDDYSIPLGGLSKEKMARPLLVLILLVLNMKQKGKY